MSRTRRASPTIRRRPRGPGCRAQGAVLAREASGLNLELSDVEVEPFRTASVLRAGARRRPVRALREHDAPIATLRARRRVLRYIAEMVRGGRGKRPSVKVGPVDVDHDHPGGEVAPHEGDGRVHDRALQQEWPLVVGAGAGRAPRGTGAGLLADIVAVARRHSQFAHAPPVARAWATAWRHGASGRASPCRVGANDRGHGELGFE